MSKRAMCGLSLALLIAAGVSMPSSAQVCEPLDDGRLTDAFYEGTVIFWDPVVEFQRITLTISGPCEDIVKTFGPKDEIMFDIREIERVTDGQYTWTLRREASIDPGVRKNLQEARGSGEEDDLWWAYFKDGKIPDGPYRESGYFTVDRGQIIDPGLTEKAAVAGKSGDRSSDLADVAIVGGVPGDGGAGGGGNVLATKDIIHNDDVIIHNSLCIGFDCVNGEVFNADTIRLKENNLRIHFQDTSVGSFPSGDWRLEANSSASGGLSYFAIQDADNSRNVVLVEDGAISDAIRVDTGGRVGFGTANPVLNLHVASGNTPGMRLEQTAASGFSAHTWDVAGNETNFFVRDVTSGSRLPFRIRPGAPTSSIDISADGEVGIGTASPTAPLHVSRSTGADATLFRLQNNGGVRFEFENTVTNNGGNWQFINTTNTGGADLVIRETVANGTEEFRLTETGNLTISGSLTVGPGGCSGCDLVFSPDYHVESIEEHSAYMWENRHLPGVGPTPEDKPMNLSTKTGGILNELEKAHIYIEQLNGTVQELKTELADKDASLVSLRERLEALERSLAEGDAQP